MWIYKCKSYLTISVLQMEVAPLTQEVLARLGVQEQNCHHTGLAMALALAMKTTLASPATCSQHVRMS